MPSRSRRLLVTYKSIAVLPRPSGSSSSLGREEEMPAFCGKSNKLFSSLAGHALNPMGVVYPAAVPACMPASQLLSTLLLLCGGGAAQRLASYASWPGFYLSNKRCWCRYLVVYIVCLALQSCRMAVLHCCKKNSRLDKTRGFNRIRLFSSAYDSGTARLVLNPQLNFFLLMLRAGKKLFVL